MLVKIMYVLFIPICIGQLTGRTAMNLPASSGNVGIEDEMEEILNVNTDSGRYTLTLTPYNTIPYSRKVEV